MIIVITGPTCVGKTKLSIELAKKLNGEIINADSTQVYRDLNIATAKVTENEKEGIPHHLFDIKDIDEEYTVFDYQKDSREEIKRIINIEKTPILVGGTGLYIKAALYDYKFNEEKIKNYDDLTNEQIYEKLCQLDCNNTIHVNNRKRLIRALSYCEVTKKPFSQKEKTEKILYDTIFIGLTTDRNILYDKINSRVNVMIQNGLLKEAYNIFKTNIRTKAITTPIGYKELFPYFKNEKTLDECLDLIRKNSRRYAKRQYTWFNNQMKINWFSVDYNNFDNTVEEVLNYIKNKSI